MPIYLAVIAIQVALIIDVIRTGRNRIWLMALMFLPLASTGAYVIIEVLPRFQHNRHVRTAKAEIVRKLDPERELRAARHQLDIADTPANRERLADALSDLGQHAEALPFYRASVGSRPDFRTGKRLAECLFLNDRAEEALELLDSLPSPFGQFDKDEGGLLRARILEDLGRNDEALAIYADVSQRMAGDEARCRHAGLLLKLGRPRDARLVLLEIEQRLKHLDRHSRQQQAPMYNWAMSELARLRS